MPKLAVLELTRLKLQHVSHVPLPCACEPEPFTVGRYSRFVSHHRLTSLPYDAVQPFHLQIYFSQGFAFFQISNGFSLFVILFFLTKKIVGYKCNNFVLYLNV